MVTQSKDSESHKCGTQGPENWRLGVSPSPGIPVASSHIPRVSQEHLCSYPKPTMGMAMASTSPHSCCLVSGGDPLGTTLIFRWQCWWHCGSSTTPSNTSPGPAARPLWCNCQGPVQGSLVRGGGLDPQLQWEVTERACVGVLGQTEDRRTSSQLHGNQMLSGKQESIVQSIWVGSWGGVQSSAVALMRCLCERV